MEYLKIFLAAALIDNFVIMRFLALCAYVGMTNSLNSSVGMGIAVTFVTVIATLVTWPLYTFVLAPLGIGFLQILVFILVIASLVQLVEFFLKKNVPALYAAMGIYLPLITTNCAILAVTFDVIDKKFDFPQALVYAMGAAVGFMLAMVLLAGIRERIRGSRIPAFLQGTPILFVVSSLMAIGFTGFSGLIR